MIKLHMWLKLNALENRNDLYISDDKVLNQLLCVFGFFKKLSYLNIASKVYSRQNNEK